MKILFISLGCDKNLADTEEMLGLLQQKGYSFTDDEEECDIIVVNTCCFIGDAKEESIRALLEAAELKKSGKVSALVACGCLAQRYYREICSEIPEVDAIVGTTALDQIVDAVELVLEGGRPTVLVQDPDAPRIPNVNRVLTTGGYYAYLKIAEGCNKRCSYCVIPQVRGGYRSVPMEILLEQANILAQQGVRELILVAQETTIYGEDRYGEKTLPLLLHELGQIPGISWIRLLYCYPEEITQELIDAIKKEPKVCHYLDIPIQHASDRILRRMGRRATQSQLRELIGQLREEIPDICLRTTLITGFPGENQEDHEKLVDFVNEMEFDRLGVFTYSQEEGTAAAEMPDQVPDEQKVAWREEIMELQQEIAFAKAEDMIGQVLTVMVEGRMAGEEEQIYVARTYRDAPGVDGYLFLHASVTLMSGDLVQAQVTGCNEYDLIGELWSEQHG
ncbi:MAG: 30S ribosomal protein S12 methylthiotransferase RimO [bacterium]|nr:30S ribosomal protein S12 methylthiotransferase RimO [bacterium]MCM1374941.1 30S ribosomal protein S12 methylthiotransferase RimO [Muribaculum sp.]